MDPFTILKIVVAALALYILTSYFVGYFRESRAIDDILLVKVDEDEDDEEYVNKLKMVKDKYYKTRSKIYLMRAFIFSVLLGGALYYMTKTQNEQKEKMNMIIEGRPPSIGTFKPPEVIQKEKKQDMRYMFFDSAPF